MKNSDISCSFQAISMQLGDRSTKRVVTPEHRRRAWKMPVNSLETRGCLIRWLLHCPHVHIAWDHYQLSLIHLRYIDGLPPPQLESHDSEYELALYAVDPHCEPDPDRPFSVIVLQGPCISTQFGDGLTDDQAIQITENAVLSCIGGYLLPDQDARAQWKSFVQREAIRAKSDSRRK